MINILLSISVNKLKKNLFLLLIIIYLKYLININKFLVQAETISNELNLDNCLAYILNMIMSFSNVCTYSFLIPDNYL